MTTEVVLLISRLSRTWSSYGHWRHKLLFQKEDTNTENTNKCKNSQSLWDDSYDDGWQLNGKSNSALLETDIDEALGSNLSLTSADITVRSILNSMEEHGWTAILIMKLRDCYQRVFEYREYNKRQNNWIQN